MNKNNIDKIGFNFDNSYSRLSNLLSKEINPTKVKKPKLIIFNKELAIKLNLNFNNINNSQIASLFSGNSLPNGSKSIAQAYAGHQFGHFTMLGDGRATLVGEHINSCKERFDIQFKGSGKTPYSRNGDGRATLVSMLREYLISEAMHSFKIKTTRGLSVVSTGEQVQREKTYMGGVLTRVSSSHIRIGTFQYLSMNGDLDTLRKLINYCLNRHFPEEPININPAITLLKLVIKTQISLIVDWMRVGFIHGVMNTDNMLISGETIDYGPCAFMDKYNPNKVFSSIDLNGRYSFVNQPIIAHWNISRLAETLIPFLAESQIKAIEIGKEIINEFEDLYSKSWIKMMKQKLGFASNENNDLKLIESLLYWMEKNNADYTNTFLHLMNSEKYQNEIYIKDSFIKIKQEIDTRKKLITESKDFKFVNPIIIPRNFKVEEALTSIHEEENYEKFNDLLDIIKNPYIEKNNTKEYQKLPDHLFENNYKTFCGT